MPDPENPPHASSSFDIYTNPKESGNANLIYILYLVAFVVGITSVVGVVIAYIAEGEAPEWLRSHYQNQINIFWKGLLYSIVSAILCVILIGFALLLATVIWYIVRVVKGMQALSKGEAIANPGSWGF